MMHDDKDTNTKGMAWLAAVLCVLLIVCCVWFASAQHKKAEAAEHGYYAKTTRVVELDREHDVVTVEDSTYNLWCFYGVEDWQIGDCASLLMYDNGTEDIYDDAIISVRYSAWTLGTWADIHSAR